MKKRFPALFLSLALCLGLAVPAFAADGDVPPTLKTPENSGILLDYMTGGGLLIGFVRDESNTVIRYGSLVPSVANPPSAPKGADIVVRGVKSADEVELSAWSYSEDAGADRFLARLFVWKTGENASTVPIPDTSSNDFTFTVPKDGQTQVTGHPTAADLGFKTNQDGAVVLDSELLYQLLGENTIIQIQVRDNTWQFWLSGEPKLISDVFTDVETGNWMSDPVAWALMNDITTGTGDDKFEPGINCTQAQILTFLYRAAREEQVKSSAEDMDKAIRWAREKGMIDGSFDGSAPCTRATAVSYIWQAFDKPAAGASASFTDVDGNDPFAGTVSWAVEKGITKGASADGAEFLPDKVCSRGEIAAFLYRAYN